MNHSRTILFGTLLLLFGGCADWTLRTFWLPTLTPHHGHGVFEDMSFRYVIYPVSSYTIKMPEFDLGKPFEAEYRVKNLPNVRSHCGVHLGFMGEEIWDGDKSAGHLTIETTDSDGTVVAKADGKLRDYVWAGRGQLNYLWQDSSFFDSYSHQEYRIRFRYEPDARLNGRKGFALVLCNGM
jgi:hypothetical protein